MKTTEAARILREWDREGRYVFLKADFAKIFDEPLGNTLTATVQRLVAAGLLTRAAHGVYVYALSDRVGATTIEDIALLLRRGHYVFLSLESALSEWGDISQIPIDRLTCMTTGRSGEYKTSFGVIEFTHTARSAQEIVDNIVRRPGHPLPIATERFALANLRRVGRNLDMINEKGEPWD